MGKKNKEKNLNGKRGLMLVISLFLAFVILVCAVCLRDTTYFHSGESHALEALQRLTGGSVLTSVLDTENIQKREALFQQEKAAYPDMAAWLIVPGTVIDYPIMQTADSDYYLDHSYNKMTDVYGTPFLDTENTPDFSDFSTTVYAHDMNNDTMFGALPELLQAERFGEITQGVLILDDGVHLLDFCACTNVPKAAAQQWGTLAAMNQLIAQAQQHRSVALTEEDRMLVLATLDDGGSTSAKEITVLVAKNGSAVT